jgi:hypothetical protein
MIVHSHWSHYDSNLEQAQFTRLHAVIAAGGEPRLEDFGELVALVHAYAYGEADGYLAEAAKYSADEIAEDSYLSAQKSLYDNYMDGDYWNCLDASQARLLSACATEGQRRAVDAIDRACRDAFEAGRKSREDLEAAPAGPRM